RADGDVLVLELAVAARNDAHDVPRGLRNRSDGESDGDRHADPRATGGELLHGRREQLGRRGTRDEEARRAAGRSLVAVEKRARPAEEADELVWKTVAQHQ